MSRIRPALFSSLLWLTACSSLNSSDTEDISPVLPGYLIGCWETEPNDPPVFREVWSRSDKGGLAGIGYVKSDADGIFKQTETMVIEASNDGYQYIASPNGQSPTVFKDESTDDQIWSFQNADHDFPQRIEYTPFRSDPTGTSSGREGYLAEISLLDGSSMMMWKFMRCEG